MQKISDQFPYAPSAILDVSYDGLQVNPGILLSPVQVSLQPDVKWLGENDAYYSLVFFDPDVPKITQLSSKIHWLVVNIPGNNIKAGMEIFDYIGAMPPLLAETQRYLFCLFKQQSILKFNEISDIQCKKFADRATFSLQLFVEKHNFEGPIAANFYIAKYDINVPSLYATLFDRYDDL